jgi:hypothetical protein
VNIDDPVIEGLIQNILQTHISPVDFTLILKGHFKPPSPNRAARVIWTLKYRGLTVQGEHLMTVFPEGTKAHLTVTFRNKKGGPAKIDTSIPITWNNSNGGAMDLFVQPPVTDEAGFTTLHADVTHLDEGNGQVSFNADGDLGEGIRTITGIFEYQNLPLGATVVNIEAGPVTPVA